MLLLATRNRGKLKELNGILGSFGVRAIDLDAAGIPTRDDEDAIEAFETFRENALAKARYFYRVSELPTLADDSGLSVDALDGAPGCTVAGTRAGMTLPALTSMRPTITS